MATALAPTLPAIALPGPRGPRRCESPVCYGCRGIFFAPIDPAIRSLMGGGRRVARGKRALPSLGEQES